MHCAFIPHYYQTKDHPKALGLTLTAYGPTGLVGSPIAGVILGGSTIYIKAYAFAGGSILGSIAPLVMIMLFNKWSKNKVAPADPEVVVDGVPV